ncbi:hypothetical protein BUALT_Bualt04G0057100 [Buddleja alternifolia]|uniref:Uncharacterized protein n=1 Tax=Buddleja alternifolia TaxID=168488 RepID=A0AAV6XR08_9LAMI|nr:hypothetical protein BUALT_Bualt04G0057100 [Buddleja alternifolia]
MGRSNDFNFWEEKVPEDQLVTAYSPRLWTKPTNLRHENSPLLPHKHHYSSLSPTSRLKSIVHGRNELTEMIKNIPESSYELSLKDMVDDHQNIEEVQEKEVAEKEKNVKHKTESKMAQKSEKGKCKQICRNESLESEIFLLKMFLPASLGSKKKSKQRKPSKICPGTSSEGSEKRDSKDWWKMILLAVKDKRTTRTINRSTSDISPSRTSPSVIKKAYQEDKEGAFSDKLSQVAKDYNL